MEEEQADADLVNEIQNAHSSATDEANDIVSLRGKGRDRVLGRKGRIPLVVTEALSKGSGTDHAPVSKDDYNFTQADVQLFYDQRICVGADEDDVLEELLEKFDLKASDVEITPMGWVMVKGMEVEDSGIDGQVIPTSGNGVATGAGSVAAQSGTEAPVVQVEAPSATVSTSSSSGAA